MFKRLSASAVPTGVRRAAVVAAPLAIATALTATTAFAAPAHASTEAAPSTAAPYCALVFSQESGADVATVAEAACAATPLAADAGLSIAPWDRTHVMMWYQAHKYNQEDPDRWESTKIYIRGKNANCDHAGYRLDPDDFWQRNISSARGHNDCNTVTMYNRNRTYSHPFRLPVPNIGPILNDNVGYMQVYFR
jgi:hypothetical protein